MSTPKCVASPAFDFVRRVRFSVCGACLVGAAMLAGTTAWAESGTPSQFSIEVGTSYEDQSSPLIRISPQGELLYLGGLQRLGASSMRIGLQGFANWQMDNGSGLSLAVDVSAKRSPALPDFNFGTASIQPAWHVPLGSGTVGAGLTLQQITVAGQSFREVSNAQVDWTHLDMDQGLWSLVIELGTNRHPVELAELNASTASVVVQRRWSQPLPWIDSIDLSAHTSIEHNDQGFSELSHRSVLISAGMQRRWRDVLWSTGLRLQRIQFDATAFVEDPVRLDRLVTFDIAVELDVTPRHSVRVEYSEAINTSTLALYDNRYQQFAIKWRTSW